MFFLNTKPCNEFIIGIKNLLDTLFDVFLFTFEPFAKLAVKFFVIICAEFLQKNKTEEVDVHVFRR